MDFLYEQNLLDQGYNIIAGCDEAGRGPMAGPIVAAAVVLRKNIPISHELFHHLNDSKKLTSRKREYLYNIVIESSESWGVGIIDNNEIDRIGIGEANREVVRRAVNALTLNPDYIAFDYIARLQFDMPYASIKKGDSMVASIAAASIIAKVSRDAMMLEAHEHYPQYGFAQHKGYGTAVHRVAIEQFGLSPLHRRSFTFNN